MTLDASKTIPPEESETRIVRPTRRVAALLGFLHKAEVDAIFKEQPFETVDGSDPLELWRQFNLKRQGLPPLTPTEDIETLPNSLNSAIANIKNRHTYKIYYEAVADYSFMLAPIESLLSPQWMADLDYIDEISSQLSSGMSLEDQLQFAISEGKITEPIINGNQVVFTSQGRDPHADQIPTVRKTEGGEFEIIVRAASRPNYIQVAGVGQRLVLINGVHKVSAMYKMGFTKTPCVFRTAHNLEDAGIDPKRTTLLSEPIFESRRPALIKDFLDPNLAVPLKMRSMFQIMQVTIGIGVANVPALPKPETEGSIPKALDESQR